MGKDKNYWFKRKRYGWGYTPVTWHGWLTVITYIALTMAGVFVILPEPSAASTDTLDAARYAVFMGFNTAIVLVISRAKGPKPRWRWGKKPGDSPKEDF